VYSSTQIDELFDEEEQKFIYHFAMQVGKDLYAGPLNIDQLNEDYSFYLNHSCNPNVIIRNDNEWIARKDIEINDEITADYCTFTIENLYIDIKKCNCGTTECRGELKKDDYKDPELVKKYWPYFYSHCKENIKQEVSLQHIVT